MDSVSADSIQRVVDNLTCRRRHSLTQRFLAIRTAKGSIPFCSSIRWRSIQSRISVSCAISSAASSSPKNCRPMVFRRERSSVAICSNSWLVILLLIRISIANVKQKKGSIVLEPLLFFLCLAFFLFLALFGFLLALLLAGLEVVVDTQGSRIAGGQGFTVAPVGFVVAA